MNRTIRVTLAGIAIVLSLAACEPKPMSALRWAFGASTEAQLVSSGITKDDGRDWLVHNGYTLSQWGPEVNWAIGSTPQTIIFTSGLAVNNAATWKGDGGWTQADTDYWYGKLRLMDRRTCAVIVLPWVTELANTSYPGLTTQVGKARAALNAITRSNTVIVDLKTVVGTGDLVDGIHFGNASVMDRYFNLINKAEASCP